MKRISFCTFTLCTSAVQLTGRVYMLEKLLAEIAILVGKEGKPSSLIMKY
jgi:hypothetical protein